jgi:NAD+ diphosphatase
VPVDWTRLPLARAAVDRAAHRRIEPELVESAWTDRRTRVLVLTGSRVATTVEGEGPELALRRPDQVDAWLAAEGRASGRGTEPAPLVLFLGEAADGGAYLGYVVSPDPATATALPPAGDALPDPPPGSRWATLRDVGHALDDHDAGLASTAVGLAAWHGRHPRCPLCGEPTVSAQGGWIRRCPADGSDHYPRTDPAVIMAVLDDDDRLLLGHAAHWPDRRFSTLAGYVETGESLESAVRREVSEEVGVAVGDVTYRGSQPWPFPASLMLAFVARALTTEITVDGVELTQARWFTRAELASAVADGSVLLPMRTSVALALIEEWFGGPVGGSWA